MAGKTLKVKMKYNWRIFGHDRQIKELENDLNASLVSHSYLFSGPSGIGKFSIAKAFAGILQCKNDYCMDCPTCKQIVANNHLDTHVFEDDGEIIGIDYVKKLISTLNLTSQSNNNIFILQNIERMNTEAFNSFLKILEEPPNNTVIILTTSDISKIIPTIVSRTRPIGFSALSNKKLETILLENFDYLDTDEINEIVYFAQGRLGMAISLMKNTEQKLEYQNMLIELRELLSTDNLAEKFLFIERLLANKETANAKIKLFLTVLTLIVRYRMVDENAINYDQNVKTLLKIAETGIFIKRNVNAKLVLENLIISL